MKFMLNRIRGCEWIKVA